MRTRIDWTDVIGGTLLLAFGLWFLAHAAESYNFGSLRRMGPGYFPAVLGVLVAAFGVLILLPALFRRGELPRPAWRPLATITVAGLSFAMMIEPLGLVPATVTLVVIAALAEPAPPVLRTVILAVCLAVMAVLVFAEGLGIPTPAFRWSY